MQEHPGIACGMFKGNKEDANRVWRSLEAELNSAGPPTKSIGEWKKVWCDQKKYVRHKAAQNLKNSKATGGGPNMEQKFSAIEESIYNLIGMRESAEGVATTFGLSSCATTKPQEKEIQPVCDDILEADDVQSEEVCQQPLPKKVRKSSPPSVSPRDVLMEEITIQKKMLEAMGEQQQNTKKIYRSLDRLNDLKKAELKEQKRHNLVMEKLRHREVEDKIEKNRRLLELKDLKTINICDKED